MSDISPFHLITQDHDELSHLQQAEAACKGGAEWIQLRVKAKLKSSELRDIAESVLEICKAYGARLIINDHPKLVKEINADGVHLGKEDMSIKEAKKMLGDGFIIGGTANKLEDIIQHHKHGADYIGLGPFRYTLTKEKLSPVLGLDGIASIREECTELGIDLPIIAIGGITVKDLRPIIDSGIHGIAVASAVNLAKDPVAATKEFIKALKK